MASPSWDSSWSQSSPVSVFSSATCCFRVCKSHPTRIMSQPSVGVTSWYSPRPRLPATSGCSHDINEAQGSEAEQSQATAPGSEEPDAGSASVLPMDLQVGDRFTAEGFEWELLTHPTAIHGAKRLRASVVRPGVPETEREVTWPAH